MLKAAPAHIKQRNSVKAQSAMEYLTTYGWAILVIAVVVAALFELGLFNQNTYSPKATPGSCIVTVNQYGGKSISGGGCNQMPQYVAQFNGQFSYVSTSLSPSTVNAPITISGWVYSPNNPASYMGYFGWRFTDSAAGSGDFYVLQLSGTNYLELRFQNSAGTQYNYESGSAVI